MDLADKLDLHARADEFASVHHLPYYGARLRAGLLLQLLLPLRNLTASPIALLLQLLLLLLLLQLLLPLRDLTASPTVLLLQLLLLLLLLLLAASAAGCCCCCC